MSRHWNHIISYVPALLLSLSLFMSACHGTTEEEVQDPSDSTEVPIDQQHGVVIYADDSTEWIVWVPYASVHVNDEYNVDSPFHIPTHEEAKILKTLTYGADGQRFLTDDGYTFGMPSASVTKAGTKRTYSVLALWRRPYTIVIDF